MSNALFTTTSYQLESLVDQVRNGQIALPDLQRPFVWPNRKVRDVFDSMYRGYPVGFFLFWETATPGQTKVIGPASGKKAPLNYLVIDGQQRLTSLFAVLTGEPVLRENFKEERLTIAFNPLDGSFDVSNAILHKDPRWIPDIAPLFAADASLFSLHGEYLARLEESREVTDEEKKRVGASLERLLKLKGFQFTALVLSAQMDAEQVADVFVRINSKGTPLNQADFILTLMSVFQDGLRRDLESFCRDCRVPTKGASPFNHFFEPDPDQLLRVAVALGFRRARLQTVYSILRGKDLDTGQFDEERRDRQFEVLAKAQADVLSLTHWHEYLRCLQSAGFRGARLISSQMAIVYCYAMFLLGRRDFGLEGGRLRALIARWFFFVSLTGRYTGSPESAMENDLAEIGNVDDADAFEARLDRMIRSELTNDYWEITLPDALESSAARSPELFAYAASLVLLEARALFSNLPISDLLDPSTRGTRSALERHHLFPKAHLRKQGIKAPRRTNQIANYALIEWDVNNRIADRSPRDYWPELRDAIAPGERADVLFQHALPENWHTLDYDDFLERRRKGIAAVIRGGFERMLRKAPTAPTIADGAIDEPTTSAPFDLRQAMLEAAPLEARPHVEELLEEDLSSTADLRQRIDDYLTELEDHLDEHEFLDLDTATRVAERCVSLLEANGDEASPERRLLVQVAVLYFVLDEDADSDITSAIGFDDDLLVVEAVEAVLNETATPSRS